MRATSASASPGGTVWGVTTLRERAAAPGIVGKGRWGGGVSIAAGSMAAIRSSGAAGSGRGAASAAGGEGGAGLAGATGPARLQQGVRRPFRSSGRRRRRVRLAAVPGWRGGRARTG